MMGTAPISHPSSPPVSLSQYYSSLLVDLEKEEDDDDDEWLWEGESALDPAEDFRSLATEGGSFTTKPDSARKSARRRSTEERKSTIVAIDDTSDRHVSSMSSPRSPLQATIPPFFTSPSYFTPFQNSLLKYYQHHCRSLYKNLPSFEDLWVLGNRVGRAELSVMNVGGSDFHQEMKDLVRFQKSVRSFISCLQSDENKQALSTRAKYFSHFKQLLEMGNSYLGICGLTRDKRSWFWEMLEEMKQRGRT